MQCRIRSWCARVVPAALLAAFPTVASAYQGGPVANGGTIKGVVRFANTYPPPDTLEVTKDFEVCGQEKRDEKFIVSPATKGLKNVVVSLVDLARGKAFAPQAATLSQKGCQYVPHLVLLPAGGTLTILNEDGILHNVHTYSKANTPLNRAQPKFKPELKETFTHPEIIKVTCDVHGWMSAYVVVEAHPYYTLSDENGAFQLTDVPPGTYKLRAWHEVIGKMEKSVTVSTGHTAEVSFEIKPR
ncbi:MAG: carboxypeptidase regulatory-like domain-containing protein [Candidatus Binatia bacterium]